MRVSSPSSAGVDSFDFSVSLAFGFAFANDLNRSPAVCVFFAPDLESDLFNVLLGADGWGVDRPDVLSSDALSLRAGTAASFFGWVVAAGFATGLAAGFGAEAAAGGGAFLGVLRCKAVSGDLQQHVDAIP